METRKVHRSRRCFLFFLSLLSLAEEEEEAGGVSFSFPFPLSAELFSGFLSPSSTTTSSPECSGVFSAEGLESLRMEWRCNVSKLQRGDANLTFFDEEEVDDFSLVFFVFEVLRRVSPRPDFFATIMRNDRRCIRQRRRLPVLN